MAGKRLLSRGCFETQIIRAGDSLTFLRMCHAGSFSLLRLSFRHAKHGLAVLAFHELSSDIIRDYQELAAAKIGAK